MSAERPRIECTLQDDVRLFPGVRAIVAHSAEQAGLSEQTQEELAKATLEVCREAFAKARNSGDRDAAIKVVVGGLSGQIEIAIEYAGDMPQSPAGKACAGTGGPDRFTGADQVRCENSQCRSRVTLIKHCDNLRSKPVD